MKFNPCEKSALMTDVVYRHMKGKGPQAAFADKDIPVATHIPHDKPIPVATLLPDHHPTYANKYHKAVHGDDSAPSTGKEKALSHHEHINRVHEILKGGKHEETPALVHHLSNLAPSHIKHIKATHGIDDEGSKNHQELIHSVTSHFNKRYVQSGSSSRSKVHEITNPHQHTPLNRDEMAMGKAEYEHLKKQYGPLVHHRLHEMAKDNDHELKTLPPGAHQDRLHHQKNLAKIHWMANQAHSEGIHGHVEDPSLKHMDHNVSRIRHGERLRGTPWIHMLAHSVAHHFDVKPDTPTGHHTGEQLHKVIQGIRDKKYTGEHMEKALKALHHDYGTMTEKQLHSILPHVGKGVKTKEGHHNQDDFISAHAHREGVKHHESTKGKANFSQEHKMLSPGTTCIYKSPTVKSGSDDDGTMRGEDVQVTVISHDAATNSYLIENPDGTRIRVKDDMLVPEGKDPENARGQVPTDESTKSYFSDEAPATSDENARVFVSGMPYIECDVPVLFRSGDYPDKNFSMTKEELAAAQMDFKPHTLPIGLSHTRTVLDGHMGTLSDFKVNDKGEHAEASAKARIPEWLHSYVKKIGDGKLAISATWDRMTKKLLGADLVPKGRIEDAALQAAFGGEPPAKRNNAGNTNASPAPAGQPEGQGPESGKTVMHGKDLGNHICCLVDDALDHHDANKEVFSAKYSKILGLIRKAAKQLGGVSRRKHPDDMDTDDQQPEGKAKFSDFPEAAELQSTVESQKKALADQTAAFSALQKENITLKADAFVSGLIFGKKIAPNEAAAIKNSYVQAAADDIATPAQFSDGKSRVQLLVAAYEAKPVNPLLKDEAAFSLLNTSDSASEKQRALELEVKRDLERTPLGREALRMKAVKS